MKNDWVETTLGDSFSIITGNTPSKKEVQNYGGVLPFVKPPDIKNSSISSSSEFLSESARPKARVLPPNSILITCIGNLGRIGINRYEVAFNQQINALKPSTFVDSKFIFYSAQTTAFKNQLEGMSTSTTIALVNKGNFNKIKIPLAPLPEQRAIVAKIEGLFSDLDQGIADLKTAQAQLKIYRQAVLKKAFEGVWEMVQLEDVSDAVGGYAFKSKTFLKDGKYQIIRIGNVRPGKIRHTASPVFLNEIEKKVQLRYSLKKDDVVISLTGTRNKRDYGFTAIIDQSNFLLNQRLAYLRFNEGFSPKFFLYYSWSEPFKAQFFGSETGNTGQGNVGMKSVKQTLVPVPSLAEQHQIVREIEARLSVCDEVEGTVFQALKKAEALRQSILKKAFEGRLLSEAELSACRAEPDWESAAALLARIQAEK